MDEVFGIELHPINLNVVDKFMKMGLRIVVDYSAIVEKNCQFVFNNHLIRFVESDEIRSLRFLVGGPF
jgi:hypothetical protein